MRPPFQDLDIEIDGGTDAGINIGDSSHLSGKVVGSLTGTVTGGAANANKLTSASTFQLSGDVSSNQITFDGQVGGTTKTFTTAISNTFIANKTLATQPNNDDEIIIKKLYSSLGFNFLDINSKVETFPKKRVNVYFEIDKGKKTKISKINFKGDRKLRDRRLRDIITSQESKFWKVLTRNTNLNESNIALDKRLLTSYYKSIGYYDVKVLSEIIELKEDFQAEITFNINAGTRYKISNCTGAEDPPIGRVSY